jgi:hypothetical protein
MQNRNNSRRKSVYEGVSRSFRTGRLEQELQILHLSSTMCCCIVSLWVSLASFAAITLCVASQRVFIVVYFVMTQSGNFWIHPRIPKWAHFYTHVNSNNTNLLRRSNTVATHCMNPRFCIMIDSEKSETFVKVIFCKGKGKGKVVPVLN